MADEFSDPPSEDARAAVDAADPAGVADAADLVATLTRERDEIYDRLLRTTAEFDNYRKRNERERRAQADQAVADVLLEVLSVMDDFERALEASGGAAHDAYRKGIELIAAKLHELIKKHGVRPIDAVGQDFNPELHQAVSYEESPGHREGEVVTEMRRGYMRGDKLLRPAMVKVAKA
jgi:molecular chaperone GrpE